jgi:hypothetical protein
MSSVSICPAHYTAGYPSTTRTLCWILVIPSNHTHPFACCGLYLHGVRLVITVIGVPYAHAAALFPALDSKHIETHTAGALHDSDYHTLANLQTDM